MLCFFVCFNPGVQLMFCHLRLDNSTLTGSRQVGINRGAFLFLAPTGRGAPGHNVHILLSIFCRKSHILLCKNQRKLHILLCNSDDFIPLGCLASYIECTLFQRTCGVSVIKHLHLLRGCRIFGVWCKKGRQSAIFKPKSLFLQKYRCLIFSLL